MVARDSNELITYWRVSDVLTTDMIFCYMSGLCYQGSPNARLFARPLCLGRLARFTLEAYCVAVSSDSGCTFRSRQFSAKLLNARVGVQTGLLRMLHSLISAYCTHDASSYGIGIYKSVV